MSTTTLTALALWALCLASFTWAIKRLFRRPAKLSQWMSTVSTLGLIFALAHGVAIGTSTSGSAILWVFGIALYSLSLGLFWSAVPLAKRNGFNIAFTQTSPNTLVRDGPYRIVRHPFYSSYIGYWTAGILTSGSLWLLPTLAVMTFLYFRASQQEEQEFLTSGHSEEYARYISRTWRFIPLIW